MVTEIYKTSDGQIFDDYQGAMDYENMKNYSVFVNNWLDNADKSSIENTYEMNYEYFEEFFGDRFS